MSRPGSTSARPRPSESCLRETRARLVEILGDRHVIADRDVLERYATDWSSAGSYMPDLVVRVASATEVSSVLEIANAHRVPVTPRGLGTGKAGGALPIHGGIVLSLERMNQVLDVSRDDMVAIVQPGVVTGDLMRQVEAEGLFYPPDPNSLAICSLGGNVACNAGGPRALKYGVTRNYVLALEVVLPNGEIISAGRRTLKHAAGYDLVGLMVGSEGTLGVITEITVRLLPKPGAVSTALVTFEDAESASRALTKLLATGLTPRTLELLDRHALTAVRTKTPGRFPESAGALIILETDGPTETRAFEEIEQAGELCLKEGALDVLVAQDEAQRERIWEPRRVLSVTLSESAPRKISEDIVVPRSEIPRFLASVTAISEENAIRVATYGHAGDGNLHVNVLFDDESAERAHRVVRQVMETAVGLRGTISGEHGIGLLKREFMALEHRPNGLSLQRLLKRTLDPQDILNPGKILPGGVTE